MHSGRHFILLDGHGPGKYLVITPVGETKYLSCNLFGDHEEYEEEHLKQNNMVTEAQMDKYHEYTNNRREEAEEYITELFKAMSPQQKKKVYNVLKAYQAHGGAS